MRPVSVVINSDGRRDSLVDTISGLRRMDYPAFEICVVCGPTEDGTREHVRLLEERGLVKAAFCSERNLSKSRNIGIALSGGEIVAFIDDDAVPEPEWLSELVVAFDDPQVAAAGGKVRDHTGWDFQYHFAMCDRLGNAVLDLAKPADEFNFPFSTLFPYVQGTNCSFRRSALVEIGGFDEEFEFFLDETDVCCRLIDSGYAVRQLDNAVVHHKYLPSSIRNNDRITTTKFPIIKNKLYFSIINNHGHFAMQRVVEDGLAFVKEQRADLERHVQAGRLGPAILESFEEEAEKGWRIGLGRGLSGRRRTQAANFFDMVAPFQSCPRICSEGPRRTFVFLCQDVPPRSIGGATRYTIDITRAIADKGHTVHLLTRGENHNRVDLEEGVWVHRLVPKDQLPEALPSGPQIPQHIWNYSATLLEEVERISGIRKIDAIEAPSWDCENVAIVLDGRFPVATNVVTALAHWLDTHEEYRNNSTWMHDFGTPMQLVETFIYEKSDLIVAASRAIVESLHERYKVPLLDSARVGYCVHGMEDMYPLPRRVPASMNDARELPKERVRILFVGRLELRKGIDLLLLDAAPALLRAFPNVEFWIAGDDSLPLDGGLTAKERFTQAYAIDNDLLARVHFLGRVEEAELRWLYANCDIFTAPSRFESFGLIFLEAMMFSKPCVGTRTSGIAEIVVDGETGFLSTPESGASLEACLRALVLDPARRLEMGASGRQRFEEQFSATVVAARRIESLATIGRAAIPVSDLELPLGVKEVDRGYLLLVDEAIALTVKVPGVVHITFYAHPWSGFAQVCLDGRVVLDADLYHPTGRYRTLSISAAAPGQRLVIRRTGQRAAASNDSEVIFCQAAHSHGR